MQHFFWADYADQRGSVAPATFPDQPGKFTLNSDVVRFQACTFNDLHRPFRLKHIHCIGHTKPQPYRADQGLSLDLLEHDGQ